MRTASKAIYEKSCAVIPGGVNSPVRSFRGLTVSPLIASSGAGDLIRDADGREYIDCCCSWGALILGHAHPSIVRAAQEQMARGSSFGITTEEEEKIARKITSLIPSIEKIRFVSSGTEAVMTAIRLARGFTGRTKIIKFTGHYHGHSDALLVRAGSGAAHLNSLATSKGIALGAIADTLCFPFNDFAALRSFFQTSPLVSDLAAVILEPIAGNMGAILPEPGFLEMLSEETKRVGALLIFDEVITGFRVSLQGAQGLYRIAPDLTCLGKIIGGGFPAAAVGGRGEILDCLAPLGEVYQAGTLSGNPVAMRAGFETLSLIEKEGFYENLSLKADRLTRPIRQALNGKRGCLQGIGSLFSLFFGLKRAASKEDLQCLDEKTFAHFFRYLFERGIFIPPSSYEAWFISSAHTEEHLDFTAAVVCSFIKEHLS